ncbi:dipicolinate synthase subunit DpsA [Mechercharimyces sp. CAU 1602]|uniref:dipicolinate synthase subunit DpsA n=1 Tax=Mechercharimyces sp. CAU 1602 TaxID=2973933 RepID=UPI002161208B|nr:dipicolinate synthase subunit DpsA [Mechercharimyces sp. CAU 1602]MCS1351260.1 dipicolinate synthase subunit DpsA [Mechercharimyces sp. CAU 1602]
MLTGKHVAFLGGDARQLEVVKRCIELDATVSLIGFDNLERPLSGASLRELTAELLRTVDLLVLPIVGPDEEGRVQSVFTNKELVLSEELLLALPNHCIVYAGMAKSYLQTLAEKHGIRLMQLLSRDDVAIYNSIPTVEGALMMAIQNTDITIHDSQCVVLGFGRVGMTMCRTLRQIGAHVAVGLRQSAQMARAYEMGIASFNMEAITERVAETDLLFNTIPAQVVTAEVIRKLPHHAVIIDLASKPGGVDFSYAKKRGVKAILAPSLPGIVAPKTAGRMIARTMTEHMLKESGQGGGQR